MKDRRRITKIKKKGRSPLSKRGPFLRPRKDPKNPERGYK